MKNFRKVLALVLVVATLFSFASMAGAKSLADYTDAADVTTANYEFAVDVLSGLEILNGYEDDTFKPTNTITRAEMAKMIAVLANAGDDNVDKLYAAACSFADVDKVNDWFASYVSYCAYTGIVAGRSATTFDPYGKVTGLETAKMLLVVMGMDAAEQGYIGANWKINVLRDADNFGLLDGFAADYDVEEAITREEAAMMMLNALKAQVIVGVLSDNIVKVTNARYEGFQFTLKDAEHEGMKVMYGNVIVAPQILATALYEGRLEIDLFARDCYGRPGTEWTLKNKKGTTIFESKFLGYGAQAEGEGYMDLNDVLEEEYKLGDYALKVWVDGKEQTGLALTAYNEGDETAVDNISALTGNGVYVEVYVYGKNINIIIINTYIGKITGIDLADNEVELSWKGKHVDYTNEWGFTVDDIGSVVLFWPCNDTDGMHDIEIIEPTTAVVTASTKDADDVITFVADGKTYEYAHNFNRVLGRAVEFGEAIEADRFGEKNDIYTDKYGYVMWHELTDTLTDKVAVVLGDTWVSKDLAEIGGTTAFRTNTADFIYFQEDTTPETLDTTRAFNTTVEGWAKYTSNKDVLIAYAVDEDGTLVYDADSDATAVSQANVDAMEITLNKGKNKVTIYGSDEAKRKITNDTKIIVRVPNYTDKDVDFDYKFFDGKDELDANYVAESFQYFESSNGRYYTYIYMDAKYAKESNRAFLLSYNSANLRWSEGSGLIGGDKYNAVIDGEAAIVVYDGESARQIGRITEPVMVTSSLVWVGMTIDEIPVWRNVEVDNAGLDFCKECEIKIDGGTMTWVCNGKCSNSHTKFSDLEGADIDEETLIVIAWPTTDGYTFEKVTEEEFFEYAAKYGWKQVKAYAEISTSDYCSELVLIVDDNYDVADFETPAEGEDITDDNLSDGE